MERIETGPTDLKAQICFLPARSTEYESPAPSPKIIHHCQLFKVQTSIIIVEERDWCCF